MKNLMKKKLLSSAISVALVAGVGFSGGAQAIHLAEDGIGQVLLAPLYLAAEGFNSEIEIVNTNPNTAVKAKVVIRSQVASQELLDFICYLTPSDVCRFELVKACGTLPANSRLPEPVLPLSNNCSSDKQYVFMRSSDDSIKSPVEADEVPASLLVDSLEGTRATWASIKPVVRGLIIPSGINDMAEVGHIEVIGAYGVQNGVPPSSNVEGRNSRAQPVYINVVEGMSKFSLAQIFDTPRLGPRGSSLEPDDLNGFNRPYEREERNQYLENSLRGTGIYVEDAPLGSLSFSRIRSSDPEWVRMFGTVEMKRTSDGRLLDRMAYRIPALAGSIGDAAVPALQSVEDGFGGTVMASIPNVPYAQPVQLGISSDNAQFDGLVISSPTYDVSVFRESGIGDSFGVRDGGIAGNVGGGFSKVVEIEAALAAKSVQGTYHDDNYANPKGPNSTNLVVTFPTRYMHGNNFDLCNALTPEQKLNKEIHGPFTPPFLANGTIVASLTAFDDFENTQVITGIPFSPPQPTSTGYKVSLVEVNYFLPRWKDTTVGADGKAVGLDFRKGWFKMDFEFRTGCPYEGAPVLAMVHKFTNYGDGVTNSQLLPLSHQPIRECGKGTVNPLCRIQRQDYPQSLTGALNSNPNPVSYTHLNQ